MLKQHVKAQATGRNLAVTHELPIIQTNENYFIEARLLHKKLKSKQEFTNWIKNRISDYGFIENEDFMINLSKSTGGRKAHDYLLTIDTAKEVAMLERNEIGRQIRKYFIAKEKELRGQTVLPKVQQLFKGIKSRKINNRIVYPYAEVLDRLGYNRRAGGSRKARYWMHFVKEGSVNFITEEFANHLYYSRAVIVNRSNMINTQPVLPFNFGDTSLLFTSKNNR